MDCKNIKLILAIVFIVITSALSFVIGVSVGVNSDQSFLTEVIIPSLSVMGSWVAGLGALAAVFTSLWLAEQQKKINGENITSVFDVFVFLPDMTERLARPSQILCNCHLD